MTAPEGERGESGVQTPVSWVRSWLGQFGPEVARHNATRACIRMGHQRRQREAMLALLEREVPRRPVIQPNMSRMRAARLRSVSNVAKR